MDSNFNVIDKHDFDLFERAPKRYLGIEDVKLFEHKGVVHFLGTEQDPITEKLRVGTGPYSVETKDRSLTSIICKSPKNRDCEKNWCYFAPDKQGDLRVLYDWSNLSIGHVSDGAYVEDSTDGTVPSFFKHLRGSTNGVLVDDEIWFLTHMVEYSSPRNYYHIIIILDRNTMKYKRNSTLFKFENTCIEYCLGMVVEQKRIIFSYSKMDRESNVSIYDRPSIDGFLFDKSEQK